MLIRLLVSIFVFAVIGNAQAVSKRFDFGTTKIRAGFAQVLAANMYSKEPGYGFEPGAAVTCADHGGKPGFCSSNKPFYFSAAVPEGNYKVTVTFGNEQATTSTVVKVELRRLMLENITTENGKFVKKTFFVNVRTPKISTGGEVKRKEREKTKEKW